MLNPRKQSQKTTYCLISQVKCMTTKTKWIGSVVACVLGALGAWDLEVHGILHEISSPDVENVLKLDGGIICTVL